MRVMLVCAILLCAASAQAQDDAARAQRLFTEGVREAREERWVAARRAFEEAYRIIQRPAILLNLAIAQSQTEQLCEARDSFQHFLREPNVSGDLRTQAEEALAELEPQIPHLRVEAAHVTPRDRVLVDGQPRARSSLERLSVNPGTHRVVIERSGTIVAQIEIEVQRATDATAHISAPPPRTVEHATETRDDPTAHVVLASVLMAAGAGLLVVDGVSIGLEGTCSRSGPGGCEQRWALEPISFGVYGAVGIASMIGSIVWLAVALSGGGPAQSTVAWTPRGLSFAWEL